MDTLREKGWRETERGGRGREAEKQKQMLTCATEMEGETETQREVVEGERSIFFLQHLS